MGEYSDASFELFGAIETIEMVIDPGRLDRLELARHGGIFYEIENLAFGGEEEVCRSLRARGIAYVFLQMGDYEHEPRTRLFTRELGEWSGPANADGEPLVLSSAIDRILEAMPDDGDDVFLRERLELLSAAPWRSHFAELRSQATPGRNEHGETK